MRSGAKGSRIVNLQGALMMIMYCFLWWGKGGDLSTFADAGEGFKSEEIRV